MLPHDLRPELIFSLILKRRSTLFTLLSLLFSFALVGCGGTSQKTADPAPAITVSISPISPSVQTGQTQQFTATVANTTNTAVTWQVNNVTGGSATLGTISATGLYTAPASVPSPAGVTISAVSQADSTKSASAIATVTAPPVVTVSLSPATATVVSGATQQFTATVTGSTNTAVTWSISGTGCTGAACGAISANGLYTAPAVVPNPNTVTVSAASQADGKKSATSTVTISAPAVVAVQVSPLTASVAPQETQAFTATVTGTTNTAVTWSVSGSGCSGNACGTIDGSGIYTAPATAPNPNTVTVTATSQADNTKSASAAVTIEAPGPITVQVSPETVTLDPKATQAFTAAVTGATNTAVTWSVWGTACSGSACGVIDNTGMYTAPAGALVPVTVTVAAFSKQDSSKSGFATVTVTAVANHNNLLNGNYAFVFSGFGNVGYGSTPTASAGSFVADGQGNISGGLLDTRTDNVSDKLTFTGTYIIGPDDRGEMKLTTSSGSITYRFAMDSSGNAKFVEFDATTDQGVHGSGLLKKQDTTAFSVASLDGPFAYLVFGGDSFYSRYAAAGRLDLKAGAVSNGVIDFTGSYLFTRRTLSGSIGDSDSTAAANGRVTADLKSFAKDGSGSSKFAVYIVSAKEVFLLDIANDGPTPFAGYMLAQQGGPYSNSSINGGMVFNTFGVDYSNAPAPDSVVGMVNADGKGSVAGILDQHMYSELSPNTSFGGTYTIAANGQGLVGFDFGPGGIKPVTIYMVGPNKALLVEGSPTTPGHDAGSGLLEPQAKGPFNTASLSGTYSMGYFGSAGQTNDGPVAQMTFDGVGNYTGIGDMSHKTDLLKDMAITGTYSISDNGRGSATNSYFGKWVVWVVSPDKAYLSSDDILQTKHVILILEK